MAVDDVILTDAFPESSAASSNVPQGRVLLGERLR